MDQLGYWYKGGKLIKLQSGVHISDIINNPKTFGFTSKYIEDTYKKYNESIGHEGKAREEIMIEAMKNGWIRIRQSSTRQGTVWIFQFDNFNTQKRDIKEVIGKLYLDDEIIKSHDVVHLLSYDGKFNKSYSKFQGEKIEDLLEEKKKKYLVEQVEEYKYFNY